MTEGSTWASKASRLPPAPGGSPKADEDKSPRALSSTLHQVGRGRICSRQSLSWLAGFPAQCPGWWPLPGFLSTPTSQMGKLRPGDDCSGGRHPLAAQLWFCLWETRGRCLQARALFAKVPSELRIEQLANGRCCDDRGGRGRTRFPLWLFSRE